LLDVLPDESSLAAVLAHELAHIMLGHNLGSKYAFSDRLLFSDESIYRNLGFRHVPAEEAAADSKAIELLKGSPYSQNLDKAGLFLRELSQLGHALPALLTPHLGNGFADNKGRVTRMVALMNSAPALDPDKLDQMSALPLGARVKLNPWDDRTELLKTTPAVITSARDKMPLEVTPFFPHLTRYGSVAPTATASAATNSN
jgi:Peptidase family M48